jgi:hypothetical protein
MALNPYRPFVDNRSMFSPLPLSLIGKPIS